MQITLEQIETSRTLEDLAYSWRVRLALDRPQQSAATRESILCWLLGERESEILNPTEIEVIHKAMVYRYRLLRQRYLGRSPQQAYRNLITVAGSLVVLRQKIRTWISMSRDR